MSTAYSLLLAGVFGHRMDPLLASPRPRRRPLPPEGGLAQGPWSCSAWAGLYFDEGTSGGLDDFDRMLQEWAEQERV
ncbi:hypothetical protein [Paenarthrobacter sp. NPDC058040]|uniref:hypothetical protein n=1 Tax=unclassified Paenarthrobacter TaxID=2634190 RepID=UPI0036DEF22A